MTAELRVATTEDAEPLSELLNAIAIEQYGEPDVSAEEMAACPRHADSSRWSSPSATGGCVGCADRRREEVRDRCWLDVRVPRRRDPSSAQSSSPRWSGRRRTSIPARAR